MAPGLTKDGLLGKALSSVLGSTFFFDLVRCQRFFAVPFAHAGRSWPPTMAAPIPNSHLPPHLREVCAILAAGLLRLRRRAAEDLNRDAAQARQPGESSLHFRPEESGHAFPTRRDA